MTISCLQGAKTLVQLSGEKLTHIQIQKILYLAHMLFIGKYGLDSPLIRNQFLAWKYGPVARQVYDHLQRFGSTKIREEAFDDIVSIMKEDKEPTKPEYKSHVDVLTDAYGRWGETEPFTLVAITHWKKGAWANSLEREEIEISNSLVLEEYNARYNGR